ncbi:MAG: N-acetylmannosamine-6-phosphate 2-epimerase [Acidobacteriota bacterium]|nr:N-acetylmannosamine-6-phosphate 2-epimerase [Acidobacteriota bacterium]
MNKTIESWRGGLIVSCQASDNSPLNKPEIIAAFAETAELGGAVGVRIDAPENIRAVSERVNVPILGIYKIVFDSSDVYITPTFAAAKQIVEAGANIIALDATRRTRPDGETLETIVARVRAELNKPVMADISSFDEGLYAAETLGVDVISTTLSGYTAETKHLIEPDFRLVERLAEKLSLPIVCEGRLRSTDDVRRAFDCGAFAVVVGGAITGIDSLVQRFVGATPRNLANAA